MVGDRNLLQHRALHVSLNEGRGERPENGLLVGADALKVMLVRSFAQDFEHLTKRFADLDPLDFQLEWPGLLVAEQNPQFRHLAGIKLFV